MTAYTILSEDTIKKDPFTQFDLWYREHLLSGMPIPESVSLGTVSTEGKVSVRTVLLKEYNENGFVFFTNYNSRKGRQITENKNVALLFYWSESGRQIRIEGVAEKIPDESSDFYFKTRPRENQLSAWASKQGNIVPNRQYLEEQHEFFSNKFSGKNVGRPSYWGGYRIIPSWFEFWQNDERRLHDRITFTKSENDWIIERLAP